MKKFLDCLTDEMKAAFTAAGYEEDLAKVGVSNRPDLCEYQCNGAMAGAKRYKKAPLIIAREVAEKLKDSEIFKSVEAVAPGFLNLKLNEEFVSGYVSEMMTEEKYGVEKPQQPLKIVIDYGGANVAKPLHVGHLRPAVIGESIKRIARYAGHEVVGDVHLGDWGMPMGQVITELSERKPDLVYFDENYEGEYPKEPPFTIGDLEEIYPAASKRCKSDEEYHKKALRTTKELQQGRRGYRALWKHILNVSVADLKVNYGKLGVDFDLWMGESDVDDLIPDMVKKMKEDGLAYISDGALVVDIGEESDKKELPPCIVLKSDGSANYETTDLATILYREKEIRPDVILYITDKRQELHFTQVFRAARRCGIAKETTRLEFLGNGTINGADGKPLKTRDGGVLRLEYMLKDVEENMQERMRESSSKTLTEEEIVKLAPVTALAAIKYGDLSNQTAKDYIYDIRKFTASEGDTGPYILYTMARIKSILRKYKEQGGEAGTRVIPADSEAMKAVLMRLAGFNQMVEDAFRERAPYKVCAYIYALANEINLFYHETKILVEENEEKKAGYIALIADALKLFEAGISMLGFSAPEKM